MTKVPDETLDRSKPDLPSSKEQGPLWLPTAQVERMMRECQSKSTDTVQLDRKVLEGLLFDSLTWRRERRSAEQSSGETPAYRVTPSAWVRYVRVPSTVDQPPGEYDAECYAGDDPPDNSPDWIPLYRKAPGTPWPARDTSMPLDHEFERALARSDIREPLEVYTSNSHRRIGLKRQYKEVVNPVRLNDGTLDISNFPLLDALVSAFNAMLARQSAQKASAHGVSKFAQPPSDPPDTEIGA